MRLATSLLALAVILPGADTPDPAAWLPAGAAIDVRLPDLARSQERWATTPYPVLLATVWGRVTVGEIRQRLEAWTVGAGAAIAGVRSVAISIDMPMSVGVAVLGNPETLRPALAGFWQGLPADGEIAVGDGRAAIHGPLVVWQSHSSEALQARPVAAVQDPTADLVADLDLRRWLPVLSAPIHGTVRLDPAGLHETATCTAGPAGTAFATGLQRWADPAELRALPATTLCAVTWSADAAATGRALEAAALGPSHPDLIAIERWAADLALPGVLETLRAADGPCTVWLGEGSPFPTATLALSLPEAVAGRWIAAASARFGLARLADGSHAGFVGLLPVAVGWLPEPGRSGRLVITTDPSGLDAWRQRKPGFADISAVRTTLGTVPERCLVLGAGRGGVSWSVLAQLAVPLFAGMGNPHVVSLPGDLRKAAGRGWLSVTIDQAGTLGLDAGGLFGGPLSMAALLGTATPVVMWIQQAQQKAAPAPPPAPAPVF